MTQTKKIGLSTATVIGINAMIGAGIFTAPAALAFYVGPAGIITYIFVIFAVWCMALSFARLAQLFPEEGSFYTYASQWGGHTIGLIASGSYIIGLMIAMGLLAQLAGIYLHDYFPSISATILGLIALGILIIINMLGGFLSQIGQFITLLCTVGPIALITMLCFSKASLSNLTPFAPYGLTNVFRATQIVIFGFFGFETATSLSTIVKDPERNVPRALTYSIIIVSLIYFLFILSIMLAVPTGAFTDPKMPITHPLTTLFPDYGWILSAIHFGITSAMLGVLNAMLWGSATLLVSLFKKLHAPMAKKLLASGKFNHATSVLIIGFMIMISYMTLKNIDLFFALTSIFLITAFLLAIATLLIDPKARKESRLLTIVGMGTALLIAGFSVEELIRQLI